MSALVENALTRVAESTGLDATSTGTTSLYTVPTGFAFMPTHIIVINEPGFTSGGKTIHAVASFGGNSATFDDFLNSVTFTFSSGGTYIMREKSTTAQVFQAGGDVFTISIETASDATLETWAVSVFGFIAD